MASRRSDVQLVVRTATIEDLARALDVHVEVASEGRWIGAELPIDRAQRTERWKKLIDNDNETMFVAELEGVIAGTASMKWVGASELGMQVLSDYRRRGVGSALVAACIEWARRERVHKIELKVWPHNAAALALYERFGFEREGYLIRHYRRSNGEIWDCIIMGLRLEDGEGS